MDKIRTGESDTEARFQYHRKLIDKWGSGTARSLGWRQPEGQIARFQMLARIGNMNPCSVLDAGCGHADLFPFLRNLYPTVYYYGIEQLPELINIAAQRYKGEKNIALLLSDFLQPGLPLADYVLASGSLTYRHSSDAFIYNAIEKLFAHCRLGLGFNLLSGGTEPSKLLVAYNPQEILRFCHTLSSKTELHEGYWKDDFTVFLYK